MITILVTTDFSTNGHWVTDYALKLAHQLSARLLLTHVYDSTPDHTPYPMGLTNDVSYYNAMQQLYRERSQLLMATDESFTVGVLGPCHTANTPSEDTVVKQKADLLVVGLENLPHQAGRQLNVLDHQPRPFTQVPVLLVPAGRIYHNPQTIRLVIDRDEPLHAHAIGTVLWISRFLKASLDVISLEENPPLLSPTKATYPIRNFLGNQLHSLRCMSGHDLIVSLKTYIEQPNEDWMILLPGLHKRLLPFLADSPLQESAH